MTPLDSLPVRDYLRAKDEPNKGNLKANDIKERGDMEVKENIEGNDDE